MTSVDIIVLLLIGGGGILGLMRGFVCETLSLIAWVLAVFAIRLFQAPAAELLTQWVGTSGGAALLALVAVGGGTFAVGKLVARAVGSRTRASVLGPVDRVLGFGFGALKGLIIATLGYLAFSLVYDTIYGGDAARPVWLGKSRTYPLLNASGAAVSEFIDERRKGSPVSGRSPGTAASVANETDPD